MAEKDLRPRTRTTLGLIGFGRFGQLAARHLKPIFDLTVADASAAARQAAKTAGVTLGAVSAAAQCDIVVVAVPVAAMRSIFTAIAPYLRPGAVVIDVGSVKMLPAAWMVELLPEEVEIVATHPLFGPQSASGGVAGLRIVVCPVRGRAYRRVARFGRQLGLEVSIASPESHDRDMAYVQALTHLIGRSLANLQIPDNLSKTPSYQHLLELCGLIGADTFELFTAIQTQNPFARGVVTAFVEEACELLDKVHTAIEGADARFIRSIISNGDVEEFSTSGRSFPKTAHAGVFPKCGDPGRSPQASPRSEGSPPRVFPGRI